MEFGLLRDIIIILALSVFVIYFFHKIKIPPIVGFLFTGVMAGPNALRLVENTHDIEIIAEIGVILLLFTIGIEFSLAKLQRIKKSVLVGGGLQVGITILVTALLTSFAGLTWQQSVFTGFLVALSSTAVVLKMIQSRGEIGTHHGQTSLAILIFQDIIIVPMMLILPFIAGEGGNLGMELLIFLGKAIFIIGATFLLAKYVMPAILYYIAKTQSRELFMITIIMVALGVAWGTSELGLSLALGSFIAGLIISESQYSEQAFGNIMPFRDVFTSFFFVSIGMLLNLEFVANNLILVLVLTGGLIALKTLVAGFAAFMLGFPFRTTVIVALTLSQIGEFSFILSRIGMDYTLFSSENYQAFLAVAVITMSLTPFIIYIAPQFAHLLLKLPIPQKIQEGLHNIPEPAMRKLNNHMIIIGYGINGRNVAKAAKFSDIPHAIIELNPDTVKDEQARGEMIFYGDATQSAVLEKANIHDANILVVTLPHTGDVKRITEIARRMNPNLHIIIRTRYITEMKTLYELGADEVIPEEFETSIEIFSRVLAKYLVSRSEIEKLVAKVREDGYEMFRSLSLPNKQIELLKVQAPEVEIHSVHVCKGASMIGKRIDNQPFYDDEKLSLLAISRKGQVLQHPANDTVIKENDILFFLGNKNKLTPYLDVFKGDDESCTTLPN